MTIYNIHIDYTTGDSFNSEQVPAEPLDIVTTSLDTAKENLARIKAHYKECGDNPNFGKRYALELKTDDGVRIITPFWIGYFETLHGAKIVIDEDTEMSFRTGT